MSDVKDGATKTCPFCAETIKAAAVVCRYCGRDIKPSPPQETVTPSSVVAQPPTAKVQALTSAPAVKPPNTASANDSGTWTIAGCLGIIILFAGCSAITSLTNDGHSHQASGPTTAPTMRPTNISDSQFQVVADVFRKAGATVEPRDPQYPDTMRVHLSERAAMTISEREAKEMAIAARDRLGENAIVYIQTPAGQTLAKAASWIH